MNGAGIFLLLKYDLPTDHRSSIYVLPQIAISLCSAYKRRMKNADFPQKYLSKKRTLWN